MHGARAIIEEVLEWRPFDSITITTLLPSPEAPRILMSYVFADGLSGGTRVEIRVAKPKPRDKAFVDHAAQHFAQTIKAEDDVLRSRAYRHLIGTSRRRRHPSVGLSM